MIWEGLCYAIVAQCTKSGAQPIMAQYQRGCHQVPSVRSPGAKRASVRGVPWSFRLRFAQNFPEKAFFRECASDQPHQMKGFTSLILGSRHRFRESPRKVRAKWHLVTASLVLGQIAQSTGIEECPFSALVIRPECS